MFAWPALQRCTRREKRRVTERISMAPMAGLEPTSPEGALTVKATWVCMALNPRAMSRVFPALPASRVARKSIQDNVLPNHVKGSSEGKNSLPFCLIFPFRGWPPGLESNQALHLPDDLREAKAVFPCPRSKGGRTPKNCFGPPGLEPALCAFHTARLLFHPGDPFLLGTP